VPAHCMRYGPEKKRRGIAICDPHADCWHNPAVRWRHPPMLLAETRRNPHSHLRPLVSNKMLLRSKLVRCFNRVVVRPPCLRAFFGERGERADSPMPDGGIHQEFRFVLLGCSPRWSCCFPRSATEFCSSKALLQAASCGTPPRPSPKFYFAVRRAARRHFCSVHCWANCFPSSSSAMIRQVSVVSTCI
jgi:hypothetical protein